MMKSRPKDRARATPDAKIKELRLQLVGAKAAAEAARQHADATKVDLKKIRKVFKHLKKTAKDARKKLKALKRELREATLAAAKPPAVTRKKADGSKKARPAAKPALGQKSAETKPATRKKKAPARPGATMAAAAPATTLSPSKPGAAGAMEENGGSPPCLLPPIEGPDEN